jgi:hypothetical protein
MATDRWIRVSDQDRQSAVEWLSEAYAVGRLNREELDERVTAAYSAKTYGELRDLTGDLPRQPVRTGLPSETVASHRAPQRASRPLVSMMIWMFFVLVLAAGLAGLVSPFDVLVAAIPLPIALLLRRSYPLTGSSAPPATASPTVAAGIPEPITVPKRKEERPGPVQDLLDGLFAEVDPGRGVGYGRFTARSSPDPSASDATQQAAASRCFLGRGPRFSLSATRTAKRRGRVLRAGQESGLGQDGKVETAGDLP